MSNIIKAIYERKMSDAKDLIDETLFKKLAEALVNIEEKNKLDPVGKEDGDIDNDGDEDDTDSYLLNRRKKIGQAMKKEDMRYEEIKMTPTPPMQRKKKTRKANKSGDKVVKKDSRSFNFKKVNDEEIKEGAPGHDREHQSAFDHTETEAKEKSLKKVKLRAKGGSY